MPYCHIRDAFETVHVYKLFYDFGRLNGLPAELPVDAYYYWTVIIEALENITDFVNIRSDEDDFLQKLYYQDPAMTEYYRLCREYCARHQIDMGTNPYWQRAELNVFSLLGDVQDEVVFTLNTKTNHVWSCRLVIEYNGEFFYEYAALIKALLGIFDFYKREVESLRAELRENGGKTGKTKEAA